MVFTADKSFRVDFLPFDCRISVLEVASAQVLRNCAEETKVSVSDLHVEYEMHRVDGRKNVLASKYEAPVYIDS